LRTGNIVASIATIAGCDISMGLTFQLLPLIMEARHTPAWLVGLVAAMGPLGILLAGPVLPSIVARFGSKTVAYIAIVTILVCLAGFPLFPWIGAWFVLRLVLGAASGALFTVSEAWILGSAEASNRGKIAALYTTALSVTFAVGPFIIPFTGFLGWMPWLIGIACVLISTFPLTLVNVSEDAFKDERGGSFGRFVTKAPLLLFAVGTVTFFDGILLSFFQIFALRSGLDLQTSSWILGAGIVGNALTQYPLGMLADRWSRMKVVVTLAIITIAMCLAMIWTVQSWLIWPVVIIGASTAFGIYTIALAIMGDEFNGPDLVAGAAAFGAMWGVGGMIGPPIAGAAIDAFGVNAMPATLAATYAVLLLGLAVTGGRLVRRVAHG
jgi:MFS family permease